MKFLCMIYEKEAEVAAMLDDEAAWKAIVNDHLEFGTAIRRSGNFVSAESLQPSNTAKTVRLRHGRTVVSDGPFTEAKEYIGGFYLLEAKDIDEAVALASRIPSIRHADIEVRPIREL